MELKEKRGRSLTLSTLLKRGVTAAGTPPICELINSLNQAKDVGAKAETEKLPQAGKRNCPGNPWKKSGSLFPR